MGKGVLVAALIGGMAAMAGAPDQLSATGDSRRVLLLLAPVSDDAALLRQQALLGPHAAGLLERDLVVVQHTGADAAAIAPGIGGPTGRFSVVLVGKDGGVKQRWAKPVPFADVAALIDTMPMRRAEMRGGAQ